jgi:predicted DNA-binding transcriptional regulator AlpA
MKEMRCFDVAHYLGVSKQRVSQLASEQGFPRPRQRADGTWIWRAGVVERWAERHWWDSKPWRRHIG